MNQTRKVANHLEILAFLRAVEAGEVGMSELQAAKCLVEIHKVQGKIPAREWSQLRSLYARASDRVRKTWIKYR